MANSKSELILKLTLVGDNAVGKTSFVKKLVENEFINEYDPTVKAEITVRMMKFKDIFVEVYLWDLPGQTTYKGIDKKFLIGADLAIFMYDVTRKSTLENVKDWFHLTSKQAKKGFTSIIIGNKNDLEKEKQVTSQEGQDLAEKLGIQWIEISVKDNYNINESISRLLSEYERKHA